MSSSQLKTQFSLYHSILRRVAIVITDISDESIASIISVRRIVFSCSVLRLLVTSNAVLRWPILVTLMMGAILSSEISVLTRARELRILEYGIIHSHRRRNLKSFIYHSVSLRNAESFMYTLRSQGPNSNYNDFEVHRKGAVEQWREKHSCGVL
jgi:hypothetical protein